METVRTTPPAFYLPPTREEMKEMAGSVGLKTYAPDLVADICNLAAGGGLTPPSSYQNEVSNWASEKLPKEDSYGGWYKKDGSHTTVLREAVADRQAKRMAYHQSVQDFLGSLDIKGAPGESPLGQAMNLLKLLATQQGGQPGGDGETLPIFSESDQQPEQVAEKLNEAVETAESLSDEERELLESEEANGQADGYGGDPTGNRKLAEDILKGRDILINLSRRLDQLVKMRVQRENRLDPDPEGDEVRSRPMKDLSEIGRIKQSEWAMPKALRTLRLVTKQCQVRERCIRRQRKQLLYVIIDCSGSMDSQERIQKAGGVLMNRLKAVLKGEAELYVRFFDSNLKREHEVRTPEQAKETMKLIASGNFSGGSTAIANCARAAKVRIDEIIAEGGTYHPELLVVTDGDDNCSSLEPGQFAGTKVHAFVVAGKNDALMNFAVQTGGVGIQNL